MRNKDKTQEPHKSQCRCMHFISFQEKQIEHCIEARICTGASACGMCIMNSTVNSK